MPLLDPSATILEIKVPKSLTPKQRRELGDLIIEHIYDRTNKGLDENGRKFKGYSKEYTSSLAGKIGGKRQGGKVDLQLSGDMLAAMTLKKSEPGKITIGFADPENRGKAEGNILGSYGQPKANPAKARPFFGISKSKVQDLIDEL